jgi:hypothetical protein
MLSIGMAAAVGFTVGIGAAVVGFTVGIGAGAVGVGNRGRPARETPKAHPRTLAAMSYWVAQYSGN